MSERVIIEKLESLLERVQENTILLQGAKDNITDLKLIITGNGDPSSGILFRLANIEKNGCSQLPKMKAAKQDDSTFKIGGASIPRTWLDKFWAMAIKGGILFLFGKEAWVQISKFIGG